ncbi:hypothetical protein HPP92_011775 [Vanilla planifolia]|uniref:Uncharacterized protein n=1 Tax=Vanilla planifolia TaxID=51239 RepID=A0A835R6P3_VANPL|nr:hypothetical protein HPP92_011775 [Vanilla planifolia]
MESALLQYHVSQGRISELEAEILHSKEQFRSACAEMSTGTSKLNLAEAKCLLLQEESKSLRDELEKFKKRVNSQEEVITRREEEFNELQQSFEEECNRNMLAEIKEKSLQLQINKLEKTITKQEEELAMKKKKELDRLNEVINDECKQRLKEEELAMKKKELDRLNEVINDECKQRLKVERTHQSMVELHAQYEEKMELLCFEVQNITEKLGRVELTKAAFEVGSHPDCEYNGINEEKYSSVSKIKILQEKITSLCLLVHKLEDELQCYADKNVFHQQELSTVKNEKKDLSEAQHELTDKLRRMELRETGLEEEMRHLHDENRSLNEKKFSSLSKIVCLQDEIISLKESKYRLEDEFKFQEEEKRVLQQEILSLKNERRVLEERHNEIVAQIEEVNFNVISLQAEMKEMHDGNKELQDTCKRYEDEKTIHAHQLNLMESIMEKNAVLEESLSDTNAQLKILLAKIKGLEEYCQSLHGIVLSHMSVKPAMISHVEAVTYNMEKLTEKTHYLRTSFLI